MKVFRVDSWNHVLVEGFCMINVDYDSKSSKWISKLKKVKMNKPLKWKKVPNPQYDPNVKPDEKPLHCKERVCIECLGHDGKGMCPYFAFSDVEKKIAKKFRKMTRNIYKD